MLKSIFSISDIIFNTLNFISVYQDLLKSFVSVLKHKMALEFVAKLECDRFCT